ncbi:attacin-A [Stomoxys calcitrans]|uniref:Attacin C-terminal domain-containing protein n=1 Tax=Stomoxys calcitrans TaxID=35570 RepID=A0A1I8NNZ4_STOCA|nr:attacin-A [Stomoxys calcitrans]
MSLNIGGTATDNAKGGHDINVKAMGQVGDNSLGAAAGVFAQGNNKHGPATTGAFAELSSNGHGLGIQHSNTHGVSKSLGENLRINTFKNDQHSVDLNAFHNRTQLQNGLKFDAVGANAAWSHAQGHSATLGVTQIPKFGITTMGATGTANLWTSQDKNSSFNMNAFGNKHISGPFRGQRDFGGGFGFSHRF